MSDSVLPNEILSAIFEEVACSPWEPPNDKLLQAVQIHPIQFPWPDDTSIRTISHVCSRWRDTALATTTCWSTIGIDLDLPYYRLVSTISKIHLYMNRNRNRAITVIIRNDNSKLSRLPPSCKALFKECIQRATRLYVRFVLSGIGRLVDENLRILPSLRHLLLWQIAGEEFGAIGLSIPLDERFPINPLWGLRAAPLLETLHTRGVPCLCLPNTPLDFPAISAVTVEEAFRSASGRSVLDNFSNVTSLNLLLAFAPRVSDCIVTFHNLQKLGLNLQTIFSLFTSSNEISTPRLLQLSIDVSKLELNHIRGDFSRLSAQFMISASSEKRIVFCGFASSKTFALHLFLLRVVSNFQFVENLTFHRCSFRFSSGWNRVWGIGREVDWDALIEEDEVLTRRL